MTITKRAAGNRKSAIPRPLNSFMIFRMEHQASVSKENPGATHQDISKKLSTKWKGLTPLERQEYSKKALTAKEEHKLLYPNYTYCPRRRDGASKKTKKSNSSKSSALQTDALDKNHQPQIQPVDSLNKGLCQLPGTTFVNPFQAVDVTIDLTDALNDDTLTTATCFDNLLLCPTLSELSSQDPSASPSTFSMMSQFSGLSPSLSSDYEPTAALHYSGYYNTISVHPYYCGSVPNTYMPSSYECVSLTDYSQLDPVAIPFDVYDAPITDLMPLQMIFPETQNHLPPAILDHTQPLLELDTQDILHNLEFNSFFNNPIISETPLLTQPFVFMDSGAMPY
ncbi:conserved hypothetical protein [Mucor ambiguus]|uniref:HMG box domain-containing protein n=1 Tax=Mucor ambiguus TaxID=91626 RepID=A0A0C9MM22_9FUNG|nr:conserved hypothetical protein [Mucor ambiguus]